MLSWSDQFWPKGTKVRVLECLGEGDTNYIGEGVLINDYDPEMNRIFENLQSILDIAPTIKMPDGRTLKGFECWWIPSEINESQHAH